MTDVNLTIGRFQPFTNGHLQMCKDGYDKNGYPTVVLMIANKRPDSRHPFSNDLVTKELEIVKKNYPFVEDVLMVQNADIVKAGQLLKENGYAAHLWLCGDDREEAYKKQAENPKYREQGGYPDTFTTYTGTGRTEGVSGTAVRETIKNGDEKSFKKLMPKGTDKLFSDFVDEMSAVKENHISLSEYLIEAVAKRTVGKYDRDKNDTSKWQVGDILSGQEGSTAYHPVWYKITKRTAKKFTCIRLEGKIHTGTKSLQWTEIPTDNRYDTIEHIATVNNKGVARIAGVEVSLWDGEPVYGSNMI